VNNIKTYQSVLAYGCSFTAGAELMDHVVHPEADKIKSIKGIDHWDQHYIKTSLKRDQLSRKERQISWAGQIASKLGLPSINHGLGGCSTAYMVYLLERHLQEKAIKDGSLVVVGVTNTTRIFHFDNDPYPRNWVLHHRSVGLPETTDNGLPLSWDHKTVLDIYNESQLLWQHTNLLLRLTQISDQLDHRVKIFFMSDHRREYDWLIDNTNLSYRPFFQQRLKAIMDHPCVYDEKYLCGFAENREEFHAYMHPRVQVHERFADWALGQLCLDQNSG
jgi:hypothetical protein